MRLFGGIVVSLLVACGSSDGGGDAAPSVPPVPADDPGTIQGVPLDGVFVSAHAAPGGNGNVEAPLTNLTDGIALAQKTHKPVYACAETYAESVVMADGVSMYGYFDCSQLLWNRTTAHASILAPTSPAVVARGLTQETHFEGFDVVAPDFSDDVATETTGSSIALSVRDATSLLVTSCSFRAGNAAFGADGTEPGLNVETLEANGTAGVAQSVTCSYGPVTCNTKVPGRPGGASACKTPETSGGAGGASGEGGFAGVPSIPDTHGQPETGTVGTAVGGAGRIANPPTLPKDGSNGAAGAAGADGVNGLYIFDLDGYRLVAATAGQDGKGGQGGGGGGSQPDYTTNGTEGDSPAGGDGHPTAALGSGGGAGGCGGLAGTQGTGGAASVAALVVNSVVTLTSVKLEAGSGGAAGRGTAGSSELTGGGPGIAPTFAGSGGKGGNGGASGLSGNGAAGPSIALAYKGTRPVTIDVALVPGTAGRGAPAIVKKTKSLPATTADSKDELAF